MIWETYLNHDGFSSCFVQMLHGQNVIEKYLRISLFYIDQYRSIFYSKICSFGLIHVSMRLVSIPQNDIMLH
jgi:hypothetical protein